MKTKQWTYSVPTKVTAFFVLVIMTLGVVGSALGISVMIQEKFYTKSFYEIKESVFQSTSNNIGRIVLEDVLDENTQEALAYCENNNFSVMIRDKNEKQLWNNSVGKESDWTLTHLYDMTDNIYTVQIYLRNEFSEQSAFSMINALTDIGFALRYWIYAIGLIALFLAVSSFVFLMCSAGHKVGQDEICAGEFTKIPFDLLTGLLMIPTFFSVQITDFFIGRGYPEAVEGILLILKLIAVIVVGTLYCINFAVRIKLGGWWKNTLLYRFVLALLRIGKGGRRRAAILMRNLPLIWKTAVFLFIISAAEAIGIIVCSYETDILLFLWFLEKIILTPVVLYLALVLRKLQKGSQMLAKGDLSYQIDTKWMVWDFKQHGENLNRIGIGMTHAVDDRMKSERFKTELLTNVSHDIKTPLTSIINYAALISKEETENKKIAEYADVLLRQSERMKKLIEDLVEASKASTGSMDVQLAPCEVGVLLTQTAGEYEQRLQDCQLELITKQLASSILILADGRHMWRIFDNLMSNICKYAQSGTRVYLNVEETNGEVLIAFKNTSKYPLDISAEELLERFARGDRARNTEGNGLGLSIAQSLMELQNGKLVLTVDGDLFKVVLHFKSFKP